MTTKLYVGDKVIIIGECLNGATGTIISVLTKKYIVELSRATRLYFDKHEVRSADMALV